MSHQKAQLWPQLATWASCVQSSVFWCGIRITPKIMSECFIERD